MVTSTSAATQAAENEKRKKQTMEKVKVNHLSRQLQMRLQYARLKVEHGWQKQNLNEVENLYFHNSHLRGPKTYPVPTIVTAQSQSASFPPPQLSFAQSRLSFRFGSTTIRNSATAGSIIGKESHSSHTSPGESNFTHVTLQETSADHPNATITTESSASLNVPENSSTSIHTDSSQSVPSPSIQSPSRPQVPTGSNEDTRKTTDDHMGFAIVESTPSPQDDQSPMDTSQNSTNHYPSVKYVRPRPNKAPPGSRAQISLTAKDLYNFGSGSSLTYDSFWSTHSGSNTPRSGRGSVGATPTEYLPTFQIPGDFTSGIQEHSRSTTSFIPSSSNFVPAPVYLETARNPGGPT